MPQATVKKGLRPDRAEAATSNGLRRVMRLPRATEPRVRAARLVCFRRAAIGVFGFLVGARHGHGLSAKFCRERYRTRPQIFCITAYIAGSCSLSSARTKG